MQWMTTHRVILPSHPQFRQFLAEVRRPDHGKKQNQTGQQQYLVFRPQQQLPDMVDNKGLQEYFYDGEHQARCRETGDVPVDGLTDEHYRAWENGEDLVFNGKVEV